MQALQIDYESLYHSICHPITVLDDDFTILSANQTTLDILGVTENKVIGKKCFKLFHGTEEPPEGCPCVKMLETRHWQTAEMEVQALNGTYIASCTPLLNNAGELDSVVHLLTNISDLKQAEHFLALRIAELNALQTVAQKVNQSLKIDVVVEAVLSELVNMELADLGMVFLRTGDDLALQQVYRSKSNMPLSGDSVKRVGECLCGLAAQGEKLFVPDIFADQRCTLNDCKEAGIKSFAALPLFDGEEVIGVLALGGEREGFFVGHERFLETITYEFSNGLINAFLYEKLQKHSLDLEKTVEEKTEMMRKFLNAMAGRENRMAELKEAIGLLQEQLEQEGMVPVAGDPLKKIN